MKTVIPEPMRLTWWQRFRQGDLWHGFRRSPTAILAALVVMACIVCALFAPWIAPHNPFDLATLDLADSHLPPAWLADGKLPDAPPAVDPAKLDPVLAGAGLVPEALIERPGGRGYLVWARREALPEDVAPVAPVAPVASAD